MPTRPSSWVRPDRVGKLDLFSGLPGLFDEAPEVPAGIDRHSPPKYPKRPAPSDGLIDEVTSSSTQTDEVSGDVVVGDLEGALAGGNALLASDPIKAMAVFVNVETVTEGLLKRTGTVACAVDVAVWLLTSTLPFHYVCFCLCI